MSEIYDRSLQKTIHDTADELGIALQDGVYL